jgi:hypothetical protein
MPLLFSPMYSSTCLLQLQSFFYLEFAWGGAPPPGLVERATLQPLLQAFTSPSILGKVAPHPPSLAICLFTVHLRDCPTPTLWGSGRPTLFATCPFFFFFTQLLVYYSVRFFLFFFPGWASVCPGDYADLAQGCLWEYHVPLSSPCGLLLSSW